MKWKIRISEVGSEVKELIQESKQFDLVIEGKRNDMRDFTVHFDGGLPVEPLKEGDEFIIGGTSLYIIALGERVNEHLKGHGACTIDFSGGLAPSGTCVIMLDGVYENFDFLRDRAVITVK